MGILGPFEGMWGYVVATGWAWTFLAFVVNLLLAIVVASDAARVERPALRVPPLLWFLAVLCGSFFAVLGYWLMHHSTLVPGQRSDGFAQG